MVLMAACGGDPDPRVIPGGGIGDGPIDGALYVFVIDDDDVPIANATVAVGGVERTTDAEGFAEFGDVSGPQTIATVATRFRSSLLVGANGTNVTVSLEPTMEATPAQATLSGTISNWNTVTVAPQHIKAALVLYSQTDDLGDPANNLVTPNMGNICGVASATCDWTLVSRTGTVTLIAAIVDRDTKGTADGADDTQEIIGWAIRRDTAVVGGVAQSGLMLQLVEVGNLETVTVDLGTPPAGLTQTGALVGVDIGEDDVLQLPSFLTTDVTTLLAPKPSQFGPDASYRLTAIAQTAAGDAGAQSILLRRNNTSPALAAGEWLVPPTGVSATRTHVEFQPVVGAKLHSINYRDAGGRQLLDIAVLDDTTSIDLPPTIALPISGALTIRAAGIGADLDVTDFSLEEDDDLLWGIAAEPVTVP
jgi:hypothetical protein